MSWARLGGWQLLAGIMCGVLFAVLLLPAGPVGGTDRSRTVTVIAPAAAAALDAASPAAGPAGGDPKSGRWITPVPGFEIVTAFDKPERNWHAGHRGIDVAALPDEPIRAPAAGRVRFAGMVAGRPVVSVETGGHVVSFEPVASDLRAGDEVWAGHPLGTLAAPAHCDTGCVHIGVWRADAEKDYLDPVAFFSRDFSILLPEAQAPEEMPQVPADEGRSGAGPWGGHSNGRIPAVAMCPLSSAPGHRLRCDAARAFDALAQAYRSDLGRPMSVTDSYRDYQTQVLLKKRKGRMAATPGRSNHGWGLAVDLGGGINRFGTREHEWMRANAPRFGWIHPAWARQSGSLPEAWHWEFAGSS